MTIWVLLAITPFITLLFLEEVIQFFYLRYLYGAGKVEKKITSIIGSGWRKTKNIIQRTKVRMEG
ncbi:hypothetical protein [Robertmurraya korlensis]|uniref:hypothetical protein n=1 Tax=Robertmurraya korlensis TaxID=519977 RepID=UPI000825DA33|nr:hypothetical protein [Robertmurraya korlensis]